MFACWEMHTRASASRILRVFNAASFNFAVASRIESARNFSSIGDNLKKDSGKSIRGSRMLRGIGLYILVARNLRLARRV